MATQRKDDPDGNEILHLAVSGELDEYRQRHTSLLDIAPDAIVVSVDRVIAYANHAALALWGATASDQLVGRTVFDLVAPAYREALAERIREAAEVGSRSPRFEHEIVRLDGTTLEVDSVASMVRYHGALARQTILRDVSERNARERALVASERRYRAFTEGVADYLFELERIDDTHVKIAWATPSFEPRSGIAVGSVFPLDVSAESLRLMPGDAWRTFMDAVRDERPGRFEGSRMFGDERKWTDLTVHPSHDRGSPRATMVVAGRDVTAAKEAEMALRESEARFRAIVGISLHLVYELALHPDDAITVRWITDRGAALLGIHAGMRLTRAEYESHLHPDDRARRAERIARLRAGHQDEREGRWLLANGEWMTSLSIEKPDGVLDDGVSLRVLGSARDVTAARRAEALQQELQRARETLELRLLGEMQLCGSPVTRVASDAVAAAGADREFGSSEVMRQVRDLAGLAADHRETVLLTGETGTGKGHLAQWIHAHGAARGAPFVSLNCSALRGDLLSSELFGSARGAFTGAARDRSGLVEEADGGTLFLDEIGEMPLEPQAALLKVLEEKSFRRLGETRVRRSDFRLICATHRDLEVDIEAGRFRRDLFYRVSVFPIHMPSLRERLDDVPDLVRALCKGLADTDVRIPAETMELLTHHPWPGNIRELRNALIRAMLLSRGMPLRPAHFPGLEPDDAGRKVDPEAPSPRSRTPKPGRALDDAGLRERLVALLAQHDGNRSRVAHELGISRTTLYRHLERLGLAGPGGTDR